MENKKGQAAMEFLMTYGWAILAAIIAIGVLAYFGVFNAGKLVPEAFTLSAPFNAKAALVDTSNVTLELTQNLGEDLVLTGVTVAGCTTTPTISLTSGFNQTTVPAKLNSSANGIIKAIGCGTFTTGNNFKSDVTIKYNRAGGALEQQSVGSLTARVR